MGRQAVILLCNANTARLTEGLQDKKGRGAKASCNVNRM